MKILSTLAITILAGGMSQTASASLGITLNYDDSNAAYSSLHNDAWGGGTSNATKLAAFKNIVRAAADRWEYAYANSTQSLNYTINVTWGAETGSTLASAGPSWDGGGNIVSASLNWDNDGTSDFYTDLDTSTSEWTESSTSTQDFGAGAVNVERVFYEASPGAARTYTDLYSVALHEIGHTLGFVGSFPSFDALDVGNDGDLDLSDGSQVAFNGGHTDFEIQTPEWAGAGTFQFPYAGSSIGEFYGSNAMSPSVVSGIRKDLTQVDIQIIADIHEFDNVNFAPIPEPSTLIFSFAGLGALMLRRKRSAA